MFASHTTLEIGCKGEAKGMLAWHIREKTCTITTTSACRAIYGLLDGKDSKAVHRDDTNRNADDPMGRCQAAVLAPQKQ
jgi:hypothetical protein